MVRKSFATFAAFPSRTRGVSILSLRVRRGAVAAVTFIAVFAFASSAGAAGPNLSRFYGQKLTWTSCEKSDQCTWLTVPRSYTTRSTHGTFRIRVIRQPATGTAAERKGVLVLNPGGPGGSGYSMIAHNTVDNAALHKAYDFVSFDPRGVGQSNPLDCGSRTCSSTRSTSRTTRRGRRSSAPRSCAPTAPSAWRAP